jgi:hypothetical protein
VTSTAGQDGTSGPQLLNDPSEVLFRQVHPNWIDNGVPSSQAFAPTKKDEGQLSITRGALTTAEAAFKHYTLVQQLESAGTWGISVGEATAAGLDSFDDYREDVPAHGFVDFRPLSRKQAERKAKLLAAWARERGRLYP